MMMNSSGVPHVTSGEIAANNAVTSAIRRRIPKARVHVVLLAQIVVAVIVVILTLSTLCPDSTNLLRLKLDKAPFARCFVHGGHGHCGVYFCGVHFDANDAHFRL